MGSAIVAAAAETREAEVVAQISRASRPPDSGDVVIDFSLPGGAQTALAWARSNQAAFVSGTTGLDDAFFAELDQAAHEIPVLHATNMSVGVAVLRALTRLAAAALPSAFQPEITESHHRHKRDAPSGTAKSLIEDIVVSRPDLRVQAGRDGAAGPRGANELGVHALRGGDVVGEHSVHFFGEGERLELSHRATDRRIFARGALSAALWMHGQAPGRYSMDDVLGLRSVG